MLQKSENTDSDLTQSTVGCRSVGADRWGRVEGLRTAEKGRWRRTHGARCISRKNVSCNVNFFLKKFKTFGLPGSQKSMYVIHIMIFAIWGESQRVGPKWLNMCEVRAPRSAFLILYEIRAPTIPMIIKMYEYEIRAWVIFFVITRKWLYFYSMGKHPILGLGQKKSGGAKKKFQGHYLMKKLSIFVFFFLGCFFGHSNRPKGTTK